MGRMGHSYVGTTFWRATRTVIFHRMRYPTLGLISSLSFPGSMVSIFSRWVFKGGSPQQRTCVMPFLVPTIPGRNWLVVYLPLWQIWVRQLGWWFPIYGKIKNVPNHQLRKKKLQVTNWEANWLIFHGSQNLAARAHGWHSPFKCFCKVVIFALPAVV